MGTSAVRGSIKCCGRPIKLRRLFVRFNAAWTLLRRESLSLKSVWSGDWQASCSSVVKAGMLKNTEQQEDADFLVTWNGKAKIK